MNESFFQYNNLIINEILNFATSAYDLFFLSGNYDSLKSETIEKATIELEKNNLIFRHFCFENSLIDDFLLNFYDKLKDFSIANQISLKKYVSANFKEKVSHYFKEISKNCIIIIENFEKIENNQDIITFLTHLASYDNIKIIISTTNKVENIFNFGGIKIAHYQIAPLNKEDFKSKLAILTQTMDSELKEKFFDITNGHELYLNMSIKYCLNTGALLCESFEKFLISKIISLTPSNYLEFFKNLCILSCPVGIDFIQEYQLGNTAFIEYLTKNYLLSTYKNEVYVKDYLKQYAFSLFSAQEKNISCTRLIKAFEQEITKSPKDRLIRLSRESMRNEIKRFSLMRPKVQTQTDKSALFFNLGVNSELKPKSALGEKLRKIKEKKNQTEQATKETKEMLIAKKLKEINQNSLVDLNKNENRKFIIELINSAREFNKKYDYRKSLEQLLRAQCIDKDNEFKIELCILIAQDYFALSEYENTQKYYNEARICAQETKDSRKSEIDYYIACLNKSLFKFKEAKDQFRKIAIHDDNSIKYRSLASLELAEIAQNEGNLKEAIQEYQNALALSMGKDKTIVCSAYYKLALLYDENGDNENASYYYKKNFQTSSNRRENKYYSISLCNLAMISKENSIYDKALQYLKMALSFDSEIDD